MAVRPAPKFRRKGNSATERVLPGTQLSSRFVRTKWRLPVTSTRMNEKPPRRCFRFSLRALLVLVAVVAIWLGWSLNWVLQRRDFIRNTQFDALTANPRAP